MKRATEAEGPEEPNRNAKLAVLDSLIFAENHARMKWTLKAIARADRILPAINRQKVTLGLA